MHDYPKDKHMLIVHKTYRVFYKRAPNATFGVYGNAKWYGSYFMDADGNRLPNVFGFKEMQDNGNVFITGTVNAT